MPKIAIDENTYERLELAAHVAGISISEVIQVLVNHPHNIVRPEQYLDESLWVSIYSNYLGSRVDGEFNPNTGAIRITSGELKGNEYRAPSSAAIAVVRNSNPERDEPHTNGWRFWKDQRTRRSLDTQFKRPT